VRIEDAFASANIGERLEGVNRSMFTDGLITADVEGFIELVEGVETIDISIE